MNRGMQGMLDWLVVTASGEAQARGYRAQLRARERDGRLEGVSRWMVVPDSRGARIGSGAATILVLWKLAAELRKRLPGTQAAIDLFAGKRIVVLHSGGDSRRLPAYAAQGKIFAPFPPAHAGGFPRTLFDEVLGDIGSLRVPSEGRVVVAAGDVLLRASRWDPDLSGPGVVGIASPEDALLGTRHGVYVLENAGTTGPCQSVRRFLQKPSIARMREVGAIEGNAATGERVLVDTGVVSLDPTAVSALLRAGGVRLDRRGVRGVTALARAIADGTCGQIDLYVHILAALPASTTLKDYVAELESVLGPLHTGARAMVTTLYRDLRGVGFSAACLPGCDFVHAGSTRELLEIHGVGPRSALVDGEVRENPRSLKGPRLGGRNLVVGLPPGTRVRLARGIGLVGLPIGARQWAMAAFGDCDDNKATMERGGTGVNRPLRKLVGAAADAVWATGEARTFWTARLWVVGTARESMAAARRVMDGKVTGAPMRSKRRSLAELLPRVNHARLIAASQATRRAELGRELIARLDSDPDLGAAEVVAAIGSAAEAKQACGTIARALSTQPATLRDARLLKLGSEIGRAFPGSDAAVRRRAAVAQGGLDDAACDAVARAVISRTSVLPAARGNRGSPPYRGGWVTAECPVRIDFAGGWTDTPPICQERGGAVVNASITLDGKRPLRARARRLDEPVIVLRSVDLGGEMTLRTGREVFDHRRDGDWSALAKAALLVSGTAPASPRERLDAWLEHAGGGVEVEFESAVPKGSGLGTSSALGATILAALDGLAGRPLGTSAAQRNRLLERATLLEQMMGTGGGWQDQSGAALGGARILRTVAGLEQLPKAERLALSFGEGSALEGRGLLYYTGYQRLAKDILRQIVLRYLARDRRTLRIVEHLRTGAERAAAALKDGNTGEFCRCVDEYWTLKRAIDPGASNAKIETIVDRVRGLLTACVMPGAGGGGFLFMIARDADAAALARKRLEVEPPNAAAGFYRFAVDGLGMVVGRENFKR